VETDQDQTATQPDQQRDLLKELIFARLPDPTVRTTQQAQRESALLKELIITRLDAMDKAITLLQSHADRQPSVDVVMSAVGALKELHDERFDSIAIQFAERDTRTEQTSRDSKVAVAAALQAAKEAVGEQNKSSALAIAKSETATTKQIDQQAVLIATATKGLEDKIGDLKDRVTANESRVLGGNKAHTDIWAYIVGGIGIVSTIITLFVLLNTKLH
jgi:hypothetical protein